MKDHYEKVITLCCFLFIFANIGLPSTSFSVYQPYIVAMPAVGNTGGSIILAVRTLTTIVAMLFVDRYFNLLGARMGVCFATILTAMGFFAYSIATAMPMFIIGAILAGAGYGFGGMVGMTMLVNRWYEGDRGSAIGFATVGSGVASIVIPIIVVAIISNISLQIAFIVEAYMALIIAAIIGVFLRNDPSAMGMQKHKHVATAAEKAHRVTHHKPIPMPNRARNRFFLALAAVGGICMGALTYLSVYLTTSGYNDFFAAAMLSVAGISLTISKYTTGKLFDKIDTARATAIMFGLQTAGILCLCAAVLVNPLFAIAGSVLFGAGMALGTVGTSEWSLELAPEHGRGKFIKNCQVVYVIGGLVMNFLPGPLKDLLGSYFYTYVILLVLSVAAMAIVVATLNRWRAPIEE